MEKKFYEDDFEQLLKDSADSFRMYPSKFVWNSIYNDLHPGKKWPSLAILLFFATSVILIGLTDKNPRIITSGNITAPKALSTFQYAAGTNRPNDKGIEENLLASNKESDHIHYAIPADNISPAEEKSFLSNSVNPKTKGAVPELQNNVTVKYPKGNVTRSTTRKAPSAKKKPAVSGVNEEGSFVSAQIIDSRAIESISITNSPSSMNDENGIEKKNEVDPGSKDSKAVSESANSKTNPQVNEKGWIEDFAFHNKPSTSKWKSRVNYEFYFTPSVGYRVISKNMPYNTANPSSLLTTGTVRNFEEAVSHAAAVNMELGGNLIYSVSNKINLKIGIQFNYTNYDINAYELKHPAIATLLLNNIHTGRPELVSRSTTLVNTEGIFSTKLKNNTYQVSLPIGADVKLAGNQQLKWFVGASIQPTYIADGNSYLLSYDYKNYVKDNSLMRKWNLNAGIETFVSYKTKSGITLNAGPQLRYQLFSTYSKEYTYDEKLYNVGLKIGIITKF